MNRSRRLSTKLIYAFILTVFLVWSLFPLFWLAITALRPNLGPLQMGNPFVFSPSLDNFCSVLSGKNLLPYFLNSLIIGLVATFLSLFFGVLAAYGLARFNFRGRRLALQWILSIRLLPPIGFVVPLFIMFKALNMLDTPATLIIVYTAFLLPFSIWMLTTTIQEIPKESEEAALLDGNNHFQVLIKIVLPSLWPAMAAVALLNIVAAWNEFLFALVFTSKKAVTLPVAITAFLGDRGVYWGEISAAALLTAIVPVLLLLLVHKQLYRGFGHWGVK